MSGIMMGVSTRAPHLIASRKMHVEAATGEIAGQQRRPGRGSYHEQSSRFPQGQRKDPCQYQCGYRGKDERCQQQTNPGIRTSSAPMGDDLTKAQAHADRNHQDKDRGWEKELHALWF